MSGISEESDKSDGFPRVILSAKPRAEDLREIAGIERRCFSDPWSLESLQAEMTSPFSVITIAYCRGRVAGYAMGMALYERGELDNLAVDPDFRRMGIGRKILDDFLRQCFRLGVGRVLLEAREGNSAAISLYKSEGFETTGRREGYYQNPDEDAILMEKLLC